MRKTGRFFSLSLLLIYTLAHSVSVTPCCRCGRVYSAQYKRACAVQNVPPVDAVKPQRLRARDASGMIGGAQAAPRPYAPPWPPPVLGQRKDARALWFPSRLSKIWTKRAEEKQEKRRGDEQRKLPPLQRRLLSPLTESQRDKSQPYVISL